jgi:hypothetical protein
MKRRIPTLAVALLLVVMGLALLAGSASAESVRSLSFKFGDLGTPNPSSFFTYEQRLAFEQEDEQLWVDSLFAGLCCPEGGHEGLYKFDMSTPGSATSVGAPFPKKAWFEACPGTNIPRECPGSWHTGNPAVDNSGTASQGRFYAVYNFPFWNEAGISAYEPNGTEIGGAFPFKTGEPSSPCWLEVDSNGVLAVSNPNTGALDEGRGVLRYSSSGTPLLPVDTKKYQDGGPCFLAFDAQDNLFVNAGNSIWKYTASSNYTLATKFLEVEKGSVGGQMAIDKSNGHVFIIAPDGARVREYDQNGNLLLVFGFTYGVWSQGFYSLAVNEATNEVYVADLGTGGKVDVFGPPHNVPQVTTDKIDAVSTTGAGVHGHIEMDGSPPVVQCFFQFGGGDDYSEGEVPCVPGASPGSPIESDTSVSAQISGLLNQNAHYQVRLVVKTAEGTAVGQAQSFTSTDPPLVRNAKIIEVTADHALLKSEIDPRNLYGAWHIEFGTEPCTGGGCENSESERYVRCGIFFCAPAPSQFTEFSRELSGLEPGETYYFRFVGENDQGGVGYGEEYEFHTFPLDPGGVDPCPNALGRRLSGASKLAHCRGYELVSAADAGGYDVESNIVEGATPLDAYPEAGDRFLYTTSSGKLPGIAGNPVNLGTDPYVATREGEKGWVTKYVGLPATLPSANPFASTLSGASSGLTDYAFGASNHCSPCFADGSTGVPIRLASGSLTQGMKGSIDVPDPESAGQVKVPLSADGEHFIFGSEQKFEPAGNVGSVSLYDRDLTTDTTQVVSTLPDGSTMSGEPAELAISNDGSHILVGLPVMVDADGNTRYDLYMHIGTSPDSVLVADTTDGVHFNGMTDDGTKVYFTSDENLADDTDSSPDIFRATVGGSSASIERVSTGSGGTGNTDICEPPDEWNVSEGGPNCGALAFAGGAGVATGDGTIYFMSPELLDGPSHGIQDEPNVYVVRPGSSAPKFAGLMDDSHIKPPPSPPRRPVITANFGGSHTGPRDVAVDENSGAVYVVEQYAGRVSRFDSEGSQFPFTAGPGAGTNKISGLNTGGRTETAIAVDNDSSSPFYGAFYTLGDASTLNVYSSTGAQLGAITGLYFACGAAVDQATGDVYVGDYSYGGIRKFHPISGTTPVTNANYEETSVRTQGMNPCQVAAGGGVAYASQYSEGPLRRFPMSSFTSSGPELIGKQVSGRAKSMYVEPSTGDVFVEEGKQIAIYTADEEEELPIAFVGVGKLSEESQGVAVNGTNHHVYATREESVLHFGYEEVPYLLIDHPGVLHATEQSETHNSADFQVASNGNDAVFTSKVQLTPRSTDGNAQVYRYDAPQDLISCVSCTPTNAITKSDAFLTPNGIDVDSKGRVYFTSLEQLTLRDTNRRTDAYEWEETSNGEGVLNLISTGTGVVNAALASVDVSGKNAYFFTRESIIPQDDNGPTMKVYTAREGGGYSYKAGGIPCQSADECRGPGTAVAPPPNVGTYEGELGNVKHIKSKGCKKGMVKKHGHCAKRRKTKSKAKRSGR